MVVTFLSGKEYKLRLTRGETVHRFREQLIEKMGDPWVVLILIDEHGCELRDGDRVLRSMQLSVILEQYESSDECPPLVDSSDPEFLSPVDGEQYVSSDEELDESSDEELVHLYTQTMTM